MNKKERDELGISQILEMIDPFSRYLEQVKRAQLRRPLQGAPAVSESYRKVAVLTDFLRRERGQKLRQYLAQIEPFTLPLNNGGSLALADLFELKSFIYHYQLLKEYLLRELPKAYRFQDLEEIFRLLDPEASRLPVFRLSPLFSAKLRDLDTKRHTLALRLKTLRHKLLEEAKAALDLPRLKEQICLSRSETDLILGLETSGYFSQINQSLANITFGLKDTAATNRIKAEIATLNKDIEAEEERILAFLSAKIYQKSEKIQKAQEELLTFAWDFLRADFGLKYQCCIPKISAKGHKIRLKQARNLALEENLKAMKRPYQRLDLFFEEKANLILGPNMGGKSSILKALAQMAELTRYAIPIAAKKAEFPYFDFAYFNHEAANENLSSFGAEVVAFSKATYKTGRGLFLLDEFARGTNPQEGEILAAATIDYLAESEHNLVAATHFNLPAKTPQIAHFQIKGIGVDFLNDLPLDSSLELRLKVLAEKMDYSLEKQNGDGAPREAIRIARALGLPDAIFLRVIAHIANESN